MHLRNVKGDTYKYGVALLRRLKQLYREFSVEHPECRSFKGDWARRANGWVARVRARVRRDPTPLKPGEFWYGAEEDRSDDDPYGLNKREVLRRCVHWFGREFLDFLPDGDRECLVALVMDDHKVAEILEALWPASASRTARPALKAIP